MASSEASFSFAVEEAGPCRKRISVKIPPERVSREFDKSYRQWAKTVPIPGFRAGKAPRKLMEKKYGEQVTLEVKRALLDEAFEKALKDNDLAPIADPELDLDAVVIEPSKQLDFDFTITVKPEFDLPDYKAIEVEVPSADPTKAELERAADALRKRKATLRPLEEGAIQAEDVVSLKVRGTIEDDDGETQEVVHHDNLAYEVGRRLLGDLIGEGLDEVLEGATAGATIKAKAFAPPYAENHPLAEREIAIEAEILDVKRPELPAFDDDFAKSFDFDSKKELLAEIEKSVRADKEQQRERMIEDLALAQLIDKSKFDLPEDMIEREAEDLARRTAYDLQMKGESEEEIAKRVGEIRARRAEESAREMKAFFILDKIVEKERILVTENEVREAVVQLAAYNQKAPEQMYEMLRDSGRLSSLRNQLREKKARAKLRQKVTVKDAAAPEAATKKATKKKKKTT